jgi:hypothetical protein
MNRGKICNGRSKVLYIPRRREREAKKEGRITGVIWPTSNTDILLSGMLARSSALLLHQESDYCAIIRSHHYSSFVMLCAPVCGIHFLNISMCFYVA